MTAPLPTSAVEVAPRLSLPRAALRFSFSRSGGPGGQNVNKLNTRATLTVSFDDLSTVMTDAALRRLEKLAGPYAAAGRLVIASDESRSQLANRKACMGKLRGLLIQAQRRPRVRRKTRPTRASVKRRLETKRKRGEAKQRRQNDRDPPKE